MDGITALSYIIVFLFGITVGSFVNVCIMRLPRGESVVSVPSHCENCGKRLRPWELIPLFSYIFLRGRCSACKCRLSPQYPLIEAGNGVLWMIIFRRFGATPMCLLTCLAASDLLVAAAVDAGTREIPPGTSIFLLALGVVRLLTDLANWPLYAIGLFSVSVPLLLILLVSRGRAIGGGDVKLMAAAGLFLGWKLCVLAFFLGCVLGSVIHLSLMAAKKAGRELALGPYLAAGIIISALFGGNLLGWYLGMF